MYALQMQLPVVTLPLVVSPFCIMIMAIISTDLQHQLGVTARYDSIRGTQVHLLILEMSTMNIGITMKD